ncbi:MAG TPA: hypothetical protein PKC76_11335 [Saprospiraceae bacterium]|nr:hypothetical protein [Saprospiraceae bacterium]HMP24719.1 hypothetical protein [Saprospiraceae bacterium]
MADIVDNLWIIRASTLFFNHKYIDKNIIDLNKNICRIGVAGQRRKCGATATLLIALLAL